MRIILPLLAFVSFMLTAAPSARAQGDSVSVRGILVVASNQAGETDRRLTAYEPTLRRILRFESYRFIGDGHASLAAPGKGGFPLGRGHKLDLEREAGDGKSLRIRVRWSEGDRSLMNTSLQLRPGVPAVLGGPAWGDKGEVCAVILIAE